MMWNWARQAAGLALAAAVALAAACVSTDLPDGAGAEHYYVAAVADYNLAKRAALKYSREPSTPDEHVDTILDTVGESDAYLKGFEQLRRGNCGDSAVAELFPHLAVACEVRDIDYHNSAGALRIASSVLRRLALGDE